MIISLVTLCWLTVLKMICCVCVCTSADVIEGKSAMLLGMSQWNSNDLAEQMDTLGHLKDQPQGKVGTTMICIVSEDTGSLVLAALISTVELLRR